MGDVIDKKPSRIRVETCSAIQSVNYGLSSRATGNMKCVCVFQRENKVISPVMSRLSFNMNNACAAKRQTSVLNDRKVHRITVYFWKMCWRNELSNDIRDVEIENENVILVANSSNNQGLHSSQTSAESLEPPVKKRSKCYQWRKVNICIYLPFVYTNDKDLKLNDR